jgi:hypothetical protein
MEPHLILFWHQCCKEYRWVKVVEDGTPGHKKIETQYWKLKELDTIQWSAQSLDLNLIEALWIDLETEMGGDMGKNKRH